MDLMPTDFLDREEFLAELSRHRRDCLRIYARALSLMVNGGT